MKLEEMTETLDSLLRLSFILMNFSLFPFPSTPEEPKCRHDGMKEELKQTIDTEREIQTYHIVCFCMY
jgi:hypothetical protein